MKSNWWHFPAMLLCAIPPIGIMVGAAYLIYIINPEMFEE